MTPSSLYTQVAQFFCLWPALKHICAYAKIDAYIHKHSVIMYIYIYMNCIYIYTVDLCHQPSTVRHMPQGTQPSIGDAWPMLRWLKSGGLVVGVWSRHRAVDSHRKARSRTTSGSSGGRNSAWQRLWLCWWGSGRGPRQCV